jgi:fructose-bisphosphate aldolase class II
MGSYKKLGLSNTKGMFEVALERKFAIPGYNFSNLEQLQAIIIGCGETNSPVILQNSPSAGKYANPIMVRYLGQGAVEMTKNLGYEIPIALHLDHGTSFELATNCIDLGFSSVMFDGSHLKYDENVDITKKIV